ncbi:MAG: PAS domain S-box protein [Rhodospirillales bacterium]|nr:PAS domain S-box protein [Rhodospirillales bacterium]
MEEKKVHTATRIWKRLGAELAIVAVLVAVSVSVLFHLIALATDEQRRVAIEADTDTVAGLVETHMDAVARLVLDYAYWDDALNHLSRSLDRAWADDNIGEQLHAVQSADVAAVIDRENVPRLLYLEGKAADAEGGFNWSALADLLALARRAAPLAGEVPRSVISFDGTFYAVAAFQLLSQSVGPADAARWRGAHPGHSTLVLGRKIDQRFVRRLTSVFHVAEVRLDAGPCPKEALGCVALGGAGAAVGHISFGARGGGGFDSRVRLPLAVILGAIVVACGLSVARLFVLVRKMAAQNAALDAEAGWRNRAEAALRESERKLRNLIDGSIQGIAVDREGKVLFANPSYAAIFGYASPQEVLDLPSSDVLFAPHERGRLKAYRRQRLRGGNVPVAYEFEGLRKDGTPIWLENRSTLVDWEGEPAVLVAVVNITERKAMERRLAHAHRMEVVGQLAGGAAHDFNNLLQVIQANIELIGLRAHGDARVVAYQENVRAAVRRGAELSQQLLSFSRRQVLHPNTVDPNRLLEATAALLRSILGEQIELDTCLEEGIASITVDPGGLENAILNIALNARAAMPGGGKLTIRSRATRLEEEVATAEVSLLPGNYIEIAVSDTGCGMPPEVRARAFEPFFTTKEVGTGSGLGLSMVYGFALQSDGHVTLASEVGAGTTVRLIFPAARGRPADDLSAGGANPAESGSGTVLVVEDDRDVRRGVVALLGSMGYDIREAETGESALAVLDQEAGIDLIFTDVVMPGGMSGIDLAGEARRRHGNSRVLLTSGYHEAALANANLADGGFALLRKPYSYVQLREAIASILSNR